jgi:hypothetical protein
MRTQWFFYVPLRKRVIAASELLCDLANQEQFEASLNKIHP